MGIGVAGDATYAPRANDPAEQTGILLPASGSCSISSCSVSTVSTFLRLARTAWPVSITSFVWPLRLRPQVGGHLADEAEPWDGKTAANWRSSRPLLVEHSLNASNHWHVTHDSNCHEGVGLILPSQNCMYAPPAAGIQSRKNTWWKEADIPYLG